MKYTWRIITAVLAVVFCTITLSTGAVFADAPPATAQSDICAGISGTSSTDATGATSCASGNGTSSVSTIIKDVINVISTIVSAAAIIMIIVGGFQYVTSGGDSGKIGNARSTITYALVGIGVVAVSQFLVQFVLGKVSK